MVTGQERGIDSWSINKAALLWVYVRGYTPLYVFSIQKPCTKKIKVEFFGSLQPCARFKYEFSNTYMIDEEFVRRITVVHRSCGMSIPGIMAGLPPVIDIHFASVWVNRASRNLRLGRDLKLVGTACVQGLFTWRPFNLWKNAIIIQAASPSICINSYLFSGRANHYWKWSRDCRRLMTLSASNPILHLRQETLCR